MSSHGASSSRTPQVPKHSGVRQVNDSLYELYKPPGTPRLQILFFHGLQLDSYSNAHVSTWESADESCIWPQKWLVEEFPHAHVLTVSYSEAIERRPQVSMDMYNVGENLVSDLMQYDVGQTAFCPVILVGHSLGGLVIKQVCRQAHQRLNNLSPGRERDKLRMFLDSVRGIFYYATPHHGSDYAKKLASRVNEPLLTFFETLSTAAARLNQEFNEISNLYGSWRFANLGESLPTRLPRILGQSEEVFIVQEASARGDNFNMKDGVDHFSISKPKGKKFRNFDKLKEFIVSIDNEPKDVHQCQGLPRHSVDLEKRALEVQEKLRDADVLGIVGMGGIGKTTIAKEVFNSISREFQYTCFLDNAKGIPIHELKEALLARFCKHGRKIESTRISWSDLEREKALIVMDDVDSESQFTVLPRLAFGVGSRLIITTRDEGILSFLKSCCLYKVDFLEPKQAEKLFCQYAELEEIPANSPQKDKLKKNIEAVVEKCGGLPLTLEVIGCYLRDHADDVNYWKQTIEKLGNGESISGSSKDRVLDTLRVSYENLAQKEQKMFIEAAIFFFEKPLDRALAAWNGAYRNAETRWENLMRRSMVKILTGEDKYGFEFKTVWVHEQLRDLAAGIAKSHVLTNRNLYEAINTSLDHVNANEVDDDTEIVSLGSDPNDRRPIKFEPLMKLRKLKYLVVSRLRPRGSLKKFPRELSLLDWQLVSLKSRPLFPQIRPNELSNLSVLELRGWAVSKGFPEALGNLTNLRILSLNELTGLNDLPENFGKLSQLKELILDNLDLQRLPASFGSLLALEVLTLCRLARLKTLPYRIFCPLRALKTLTICALDLEALPNSLGQLSALRSLTIRSCPRLSSLPDSLGDLTGLELLSLEEVSEVEALPETVGQLLALRRLTLHSTGIVFLPERFGELTALQTLRIEGDNKLEKLPDSFGNLCALHELSIYSGNLEALPQNFENLSSLKRLDIEARSLVSMPESTGRLSALQYLRVRADSLETLPDSLGNLSSLKRLTIDARSLVSMPESTGQLSALEDLTVTADSLETLPDSLGNLSSLKRLTIDARSLVGMPESTGQLSALKCLSVTAGSLETLPDSLGNLSSLKTLDIEARSLVSMPESTGQLSALESLTVMADSLETLPDSFGNLSSLERLSIQARSLVSMPESTGHLYALEYLIMRADSLETLPDSFGNLSSLQILNIKARSLVSMPESTGQLSALRYLNVIADSLETLPDSLGNLCSLKTLDIKARSLVSMPESTGRLHSLSSLMIEAASIRNLPSSIGQLSALWFLCIICDRPMKLPDSLADLSSLKDLIILENSLDSVQAEWLASLGWVVPRKYRVEPPRGQPMFMLLLSPCLGLSRESHATGGRGRVVRLLRSGVGTN